MAEHGYLREPDEAGMGRAERAIRAAGVVSLAISAVALGLGYWLLPLMFAFPEALSQRLAFAVQWSVVVLLCVVVAIGMVSTARRFSPSDIGGAAAGNPGRKVAIRTAFLNNTLEQAVVAIGMYLALATLVHGPWLSLIPVGVALFVVGRVLFFRGYAQGVEGRALGMTLTMTPTILGYVVVLVLLVRSWFQPMA